MDTRVIIILAGNKGEYQNYIVALDLDPKRHIYGEDSRMHGFRAREFKVIGTFWDRKDAHELYRLAESRII